MDGPTAEDVTFPADSLALGVVVLIGLTLAQKLLGFGRGLLFCGWLDEAALGQWSMAQNFLSLAAPLLVLGIPGTFGRYLAHYHARGQGRTFLVRTLAVSAVVAGAGLAAMLALGPEVGRLVFGAGADPGLVTASLVAVGLVLVMNVGFEILTAGRQNRSAALVHTVHSVLFAGLGVAWLAVGPRQAETVVVAFAASSALAAGYAWWGVARLWRHLGPGPATVGADAGRPLAHGRLWRHIVPLALSVWTMNLLANLYEAADRYVLLHGTGRTAAEAIGLIGQYHASLILPLLISGGGSALAAVALPHLAHAWEDGRRDRLAAMQQGLLRLTAVGTTGVGLAALAVAPWLFGTAWSGRFAAGEAVLPLALAHGSLLALVFLAQNELWVRDRGRRGVAVVAVGLAVNVGLNLLLAPGWGLGGVMAATLTATAVTLALMLDQCRRAGGALPRAVVGLLGLPLTVAAGPVVGSALFAGGLIAAGAAGVLVTRPERQALTAAVARRLRRPARASDG